MPDKEKMNESLKEWAFLLEGLGKAKYKLYKYSRIYDKILKENSKQDAKILLPIAYRTFRSLNDIKVSRSHKTALDIITYEDRDIEGENEIQTLFCESVSQMLIEMIKKGNLESIAYLKVERKNGETIINAIY